MEKWKEGLIYLMIIIMLVIVSIYVVYNQPQKEEHRIELSWFEGTWLNNEEYDVATIQLHFYNVFDDVIIYTRDIGETNWSNPIISHFDVFYNGRLNYYKNHILQFDEPLVDDTVLYVCSFWGTNDDVFEIYYGDNEFMRFYRVKP